MPRKFKAIIIDDEELARKDLSAVLEKFEEVEVIGEADCISDAVSVVEKLNPNLIFLDVQMPGESGFDLLDKINYQPHIVFVTAYDRYAIRAFEVNAKDYLLKPVNPERIAQTFERLNDFTEEKISDWKKLNYDDVVFLVLNNKYKFLKVNSILAITSAGDYTEVLMNNGHKGITQKTMKEWEARLPEKNFSRIHRSTIINIDFIENIEEWFNYSYKIFLKGISKPFVMSRRYAAKLKQTLG